MTISGESPAEWSDSIEPYAPQAVGEAKGLLAKDFTPAEVFLAALPVSREIAKSFAQCSGERPVCVPFKNDLTSWASRGGRGPPTEWKLRQHTSRAAGSDGTKAERLQYPRPGPDDPVSTFEHRMTVCEGLAKAFNRHVEELPEVDGFRIQNTE